MKGEPQMFKRNLTFGDGLAITMLLIFMIAWNVLFFIGMEQTEFKNGIGWWLGVFLMLFWLIPPIWAATLVARVVRGEEMTS